MIRRAVCISFALLLVVFAFRIAWELPGMIAGDIAAAREAK